MYGDGPECVSKCVDVQSSKPAPGHAQPAAGVARLLLGSAASPEVAPQLPESGQLQGGEGRRVQLCCVLGGIYSGKRKGPLQNV